MTRTQAAAKRFFDVAVSSVGLILFSWLIVLAFVLAALSTGSNGFFTQERVGRKGCIFKIIKIRTMRNDPRNSSTVTVSGDPRITRIGSVMRKLKIDELPQLINVLRGDMSIVGPRPDVSGFADGLVGQDAQVLTVRPGITGPATLRFRSEEKVLNECENPEEYNSRVIYPEKTRLNLEYVRNYSFWNDIVIIWKTIAGSA
jgi:lipopolysaccharide/colanic/teichoic acid biosynthesis glycosyltransferase